MITWVNTRLIIEKPVTHEKYYPTVLEATTQKSYPFSVSYADIEISSNVIGSTSSYISQFRFDDIVRLLVSIKYNPNQRTVWQELFSGRIMDLECEYSNNNNVTIHCQGHEAEATTALIEETKSYTTSTDARTVLSYFAPKYLTRLTYSASYADAGVLFPTYDSTADQTYMNDLFSDMEKTAGYDWAIQTIPTYSEGNLSTVYLQWKQFSQTVTDKYKAIEGTQRVLNSSFSIDGVEVRTAYKVKGDTPSGSSQYTGTASDTSLITLYGKRTEVETQKWIKSNSLCSTIAAGLLSEGSTPPLSGQVTMLGCPDANIGDYVYCKFPSIDLNGTYVDTNLHVKRVSHNISDNFFSTTLDLEKIKKTSEDWIAKIATVSKCTKKNQVTT